MKYSNLLLVLIIGFASASCSNAQNSASTNSVTNVGVEEFKGLIDKEDGIVLDVRTENEYNTGHIDNALLIDWYSNNWEEEALKLDKAKPIYVYCRSGSRSNSATKKLAELGFEKIYNLKGGFLAWQRASK